MPELGVRRRGAALVLTLDRPSARNALTPTLIMALRDALAEFAIDDALRVAVLHGAGETFCSGMDLKLFAAGAFDESAEEAFSRIVEQPPPKPVIAAVEGSAVAGGWELALACDLTIASRTARFAMPEVRRGIVPTGGALLRLPRRMPYALALELLLTGTPVDAEWAGRQGLVNRLCEPGEALDAALALAGTIAEGAPIATRDILHVVRRAADVPDSEVWAWQRRVGERSLSSDDAREGAVAFAERRAPAWRGR
jgi:enoyl-CoA hydratase